VDSRLPGLDTAKLDSDIATSVGDVYNADDVEKTLNNVTRQVNRAGYPFAQVRPTGQRDPASHQVSLGFVVEDGPHVYVERINIAATPAPATTSSAASSISRRAMPTTAC